MNKLTFNTDFDVLKGSDAILMMLDRAAERTFRQGTQEFGLIRGHIFVSDSLYKEIDDYLKRLLAGEIEASSNNLDK